MIKAQVISLNQVHREETSHVIPLASFGDKMLTVSSDFVYTVTQNGNNLCVTKSLDLALKKYNCIKTNEPPINESLTGESKKL